MLCRDIGSVNPFTSSARMRRMQREIGDAAGAQTSQISVNPQGHMSYATQERVQPKVSQRGELLRIRGLRVHNLRNLDLDLPLRRLVLITGVSGSGKSSLAFDTLFAEGQRRYVETFSAYTRQFLERMDRPDADEITGVPPAIAIRQRFRRHTGRSTVGTLTEAEDYLRLLFAKLATVYCLDCGVPVRSFEADAVAEDLRRLPAGSRALLVFRRSRLQGERWLDVVNALREAGFVRVVAAGRMLRLDDAALAEALAEAEEMVVVVDRFVAGRTEEARLRDSAETCFSEGNGQLEVWFQTAEDVAPSDGVGVGSEEVDGQTWCVWRYGAQWRCHQCGRDYPPPDHRLFSSRSSIGACPTCRGFGDVIDIDEGKVVPDPRLSIEDGAIHPWQTPLGRGHYTRFLKAARGRVPLDVPYAELSEEARRIIWDGVPGTRFTGLRGLFNRLETKKYKVHVRIFLARYRGYSKCPDCEGRRLRPEALAARLGGYHFADLLAMRIDALVKFLGETTYEERLQPIVRSLLPQVMRRLNLLQQVGLGYLTLDRPTRTLSTGEVHRVALTRALGAGLVNTMYVLDEPSVGLHERDTERLLQVIRRLCDEGNTVVVVEHDLKFLRIADHVVDLGPGGGIHGGRVMYSGPVDGLSEAEGSVTGDFVAGRKRIWPPKERREPTDWIVLRGARGHNLKNITVRFPLGVLCVVTGVSGSGKSSLVLETLCPALAATLGEAQKRPLPFDSIEGGEELEDLILVDQNIAKTSRSNPATYVKAFDAIRTLFANTPEARIRGYYLSEFSYNSPHGRCPACQGAGRQVIDMQFLADIVMTCPDCGGARYKPRVLEVRFRGKSIADVLNMSVQEAVRFFRGYPDVVNRLEPLMEVGLEYVTLGQSCDTLSGGELQRLRLAAFLARRRSKPTLFVFDEPTNGLHLADLRRLLACLRRLIDQGHSVIVIEHNLELIKCADWVIDLGPEAAEGGGTVVVAGPPEAVARCDRSITGRYLRDYL